MSQINTNTIKDASGGNTATINGMTPTASSLQGFRNRIFNGGMDIDQRNAGASVTPTIDTTYTLDRWQSRLSQASKYTVQQSSTKPSGFSNSLLVTSSSAYSVGASDYFAQVQAIEGFNVADLGWGAAGAQSVTLSFWVRSSLTGTFGGGIRNSGATRSYPFSYTISSANTFEYKTITIPGDTTGTWLTTNGIGMEIWWGLGVGSTYSGTAGSWTAANYVSATGATSVVGTNGATFYITGVQLEAGSVATPFERRPYGTELALCQRYYQKYTYTGVDGYANGSGSTYSISSSFWWTVQMRAAPTVTFGSAGFTQNTSNTVPDIFVIPPTTSYLLVQVSPSGAGRTYLYNPVFATAEL